MDNASGGEVFGHFMHRGGHAWEPMLSESSELFQAIVSDGEPRVAAALRSRPELRDSMLTLLYWGSDPKGAQSMRDTKTAVSVKHRTPLMLAAHAGSVAVVSLLLNQGADMRAKSVEDGLTAIEAAEKSGAPTTTTIVSMLRDAEARQMSEAAFRAAGAVDNASAAAAAAYGLDVASQMAQQHQQGMELYHAEGFGPFGGNELTFPEYSTDKFRVFHFKVTRCCKRFAHDWRTCPFAHPTENARRRNPRDFQYCALACPDYKQGFCVRGDACGFAHGVFEAWLHPSRYRTQLCKDGSGCHRPVCFFAHRLDELRTPTHTWMPSAEELLAAGVVPPSGAIAGGEGNSGNGDGGGGSGSGGSVGGPANSGSEGVVNQQMLGGLAARSTLPVRTGAVAVASQAQSAPPTALQQQELLSQLALRTPPEDQPMTTPEAAAAIMAFDELLSNTTGLIEGMPSGLDVIGRPQALSTGGVPSANASSHAGSIGGRLADLAGGSTLSSSSSSRQGTHDGSELHTLEATTGFETLNPQLAVEPTALSGALPPPSAQAAAVAAAFQTSADEVVAVAMAAAATSPGALLGFTAPRMSNAFARRHGLNPRDNAMINLQKLAIQTQVPPQPQQPQHNNHNNQKPFGRQAGHDGRGAAAYRPDGGGGGSGGSGGYHQHSGQHQQQFQQQQQQQQQQQAYLLGVPQASRGLQQQKGAGWGGQLSFPGATAPGAGGGRGGNSGRDRGGGSAGGGGRGSSAAQMQQLMMYNGGTMYNGGASSVDMQRMYGGNSSGSQQMYGGGAGMPQMDYRGQGSGGGPISQDSPSMAVLNQSLASLSMQQQQGQHGGGGGGGGGMAGQQGVDLVPFGAANMASLAAAMPTSSPPGYMSYN